MGTTKITTFEALLADLFNDSSLRRFIVQLPRGTELLAELPGPGTPLATVTHAAAQLLASYGLVTAALARLQLVRPHRGADIERIRGSFKGPETGVPPAAAPSGAVLCNVPRASQCFVGRDAELAQLKRRLRHSDAIGVAAAVEGLAGIGKTELAIQLVHRLHQQEAYAGGIYWFNAENPDLTTTWGQVVADEIGVGDGLLAERANLAIQKLSRCGAPLLLVLDDVESWSGTQRPRPLPRGSHVHLLITTRYRNLGGAQFAPLAVGVLARESALALLNTLSRRDLTAAPGIDDLLAYLDGHALAIELASIYLCEFSSETPANYLACVLRDTGVEEEVFRKTRYESTVYRAFMTIWDQLDTTARHAWQIAACFAPETASYGLAAAVGLDKSALRVLRRWHLISDDAHSERWNMHRLLRQFGNRIGSAADRARARRQFVMGCAGYADTMDEHLGFRAYGLDRTHIDAALDMAPAVLDDHPALVASFQSDVAGALRALGEYAQARQLFELALEADLAISGPSHPQVATTRNNLALVLQDLGDLEPARELFELALEVELATLGPAHPAVATTRNNLALVLRDLGDLEPARALLQLALEADLATAGPANPNIATTRNNLALVLQDLGDLQSARELLQLALDAELNVFGPAHPNVATTCHNLARVLKELNELDLARELCQLALESDLCTFGPEHLNVAIRRNNLATVLHALGDLAPARMLCQLALETELVILGPLHPQVAITRNNLALVLRDLGELEPARALLQLALESELATLGSSHPQVAATRNNLALVLRDLGELEPARELLQLALQGLLAKWGPDHPRVAKVREKLDSVCATLAAASK